MNHVSNRQKRVWTTLATTAGLTLGVVGLTIMSAGASPPSEPDEDGADRAARIAERAAASEASIRTLRLEAADKSAAGAGRENAQAMIDVAQRLGPIELTKVPEDWVAAGLDIDAAEVDDQGRLVQVLPDGSRVVLTIDAELQSRLESLVRQQPVPHGSVVLLDPPTGRVLAMAENSRADNHYQYEHFARNAAPPSASVFKIVTAAALIEGAGQDPLAEVCYHGGTRGLTRRNIVGDPNLDNRCDNLGGALARSLNSLIAKQTYNHLDSDDLSEWAERFGYNQEIPFELPVDISTADFGDDPLERARAAAGFWHTHLSPLHGAMIAATLANDGVMMAPTLIAAYEDPDGEVIFEHEPQVFREVMSAQTAETLHDMMVDTTVRGTARRYFAHRRAFPRQVTVSGKTGTLSNQDPFLRFTWFVGVANHEMWEDHPGVAISGLMANEPTWYMVGPQAASEGLRHYFNIVGDRRAERDAIVAR